jgi:predicted permease
VSWGASVPLYGGSWLSPVHARADEPPRSNYTRCTVVAPDYFAAIGTPLKQGRAFTEAEAGQEASLAIVNEALAQKLWPGENAVGRILYSIEDPSTQVVGVVANSHYERLGAADEPGIYFLARPLARKSATSKTPRSMAVVVRTEGDPRASIAAVREAVRALDPKLWPVIRVLEDGLGEQLKASRVGAWLAAALGSIAVVITAIGLYGVIAYTTSQRTREIGVRMALGAQPADVLRLVMGQGWRLVMIGIGLGLLGAFALSRLLAKFLYGLSALDPIAFGGVATALAIVAMLACYLPARRAMKVNPTAALRCE